MLRLTALAIAAVCSISPWFTAVRCNDGTPFCCKLQGRTCFGSTCSAVAARPCLPQAPAEVAASALQSCCDGSRRCLCHLAQTVSNALCVAPLTWLPGYAEAVSSGQLFQHDGPLAEVDAEIADLVRSEKQRQVSLQLFEPCSKVFSNCCGHLEMFDANHRRHLIPALCNLVALHIDGWNCYALARSPIANVLFCGRAGLSLMGWCVRWRAWS